MKAVREWLWLLAASIVLLYFETSRAQWTSIVLPQSLQGVAVQTTSPVNARCQSVVVNQSSRTCGDPTTTPSFHVSKSDQEVLFTLPPGTTLTLLEAQRDPDGFAVKVRDSEGATFWIFESNNSSSVHLGGNHLNQLLHEVVVAEAVTAVQTTTVASTTPSMNQPCNCQPQQAQTNVPQIPAFGSDTDAGEGFHDLCSSFISETGEYGPNGTIIANELSAPHRQRLFSDDFVSRFTGMTEICPNFPNLTDSQKERFWIWTFMAIAHVESKCGVYNQGLTPGPSGIPWGILQMEWRAQGLDGNRSVWAGNPNPERACRAPDISVTRPNLACGLDTMISYISGFHICGKQEFPGQPPVLKNPETCTVPLTGIYWQKMRTPNGDINRRIRAFEACGANP